MAVDWSFEQFATSIAQMDKPELKQKIKSFSGRIRLDFTEDYLNAAPADRLRHILLAAMFYAKGRN
jgi:hypothetical protein